MTIWAWGRRARRLARVIFPCGGRNSRRIHPKDARAEATSLHMGAPPMLVIHGVPADGMTSAITSSRSAGCLSAWEPNTKNVAVMSCASSWSSTQSVMDGSGPSSNVKCTAFDASVAHRVPVHHHVKQDGANAACALAKPPPDFGPFIVHEGRPPGLTLPHGLRFSGDRSQMAKARGKRPTHTKSRKTPRVPSSTCWTCSPTPLAPDST